MKILIIGNFHHKNMIGLKLLLKETDFTYKFGNINEIIEFDIIYSPNIPIDSSKFPNKKFIFGPHFSVFPDNRLLQINNIYKNVIYIQPSDWARDTWINMNAEIVLPIKTFSFPVEIDKFKPIENSKKNEIFIYFKRRKISELNLITNFLDKKNIDYKIFDYVKKYKEEDYLNCLQNAKYGIIIDAHESQGFAIGEALSCNIPLLVWDAHSMSQEEGAKYPDIFCTSISYWDERCGECFYRQDEFQESYDKFIKKMDSYKPREYIIKNLGPKKCAENFVNLINSF